MAMEWLRRNTEQDPDNKQGEFKPEQLKSELEASSKAQLDAFKAEMAEQLKPVSEIAEFLKAQRAASARAQEAAKNKTRIEELEVDDDLWITNPAEAARRTNQPFIEQAQATAAITMRREILGSKEYYHGEFKDAVDAMIEQQPLHLRANASVLNNCYKVVLADNLDKIQEGKLKKQTFGAAFSGSGTGSPQGTSKEQEEKLSEDELFFARKFGMDEKQWTESKRELNYV